MNFSEWVQTALLGTERHAPPRTFEESTLGGVLRRIPTDDRVRTVLSSAAVMAGYERVGRGPERLPGSTPPACPDEVQSRVGAAAGDLLRRILEGERPFLRSEWLSLATARDLLAPPMALPGLLEWGAREPAVREELVPVLGERGRWLAAMRPEWEWVTGDRRDESQWQTGDVATRELFLRHLRRSDPERALTLLGETWKQESPDDRLRLLDVLASGLSPFDEPFLETVLRDKRKEVRRRAAEFLMRLPESDLVRRMKVRALPLLKFIPATAGSLLKLSKSKPASVEVILPESCPPEWQRDGIEVRALPGFGEKASWMIQLLDGVPLSTWTDAWEVNPSVIVEASLSGEWSKELMDAWSRAVVRQQNPEWAVVCLDWARKLQRWDLLESLLHVLPQSAWEIDLSRILTEEKTVAHDRMGALLLSGSGRWSDTFSATVLGWLRALTGQPSGDWMLRNQLKHIAARLHPTQLKPASEGWETVSASWEFWSKGMDEFFAVVQFRQELQTAFAET